MPVMPHTDLSGLLRAVEMHDGSAADCVLVVAESLHDAAGLHIALLTDRILAKGWEPASVECFDGFRIYRYCTMELADPAIPPVQLSPFRPSIPH